jgi:hypothetical protein
MVENGMKIISKILFGLILIYAAKQLFKINDDKFL